ncbi:hypothetical protein ACFPYJ_04940 [Paenibacillus solisilvae]|uniref:Uncharacterized protein n=1 Tax=Paenibacillus solisilvae TaxID=2486751 RepID=A0ABW0VRK3_9BACL
MADDRREGMIKVPTVLRNRKTGEIACGILRNAYDIEYYGAYWWEDNETAESRVSYLLNEVLRVYEEESDWELLEVRDERLKMFNVKLNNDTRRRLYLNADGTIIIQKG